MKHLAEDLALLVALTSMDEERRAEFQPLIAQVRRMELTLREIYAESEETVIYAKFGRV